MSRLALHWGIVLAFLRPPIHSRFFLLGYAFPLINVGSNVEKREGYVTSFNRAGDYEKGILRKAWVGSNPCLPRTLPRRVGVGGKRILFCITPNRALMQVGHKSA